MRNQLERVTEVATPPATARRMNPALTQARSRMGSFFRPKRVGELHGDVGTHDHAEVPPGQQHGQPDRGGEQDHPDGEGQGDRDHAGGHRTGALGRVLPIGGRRRRASFRK